MKEKKPRHDTEIKKEIAQVYLEGRRGAPSLAAELGVHVNTIYKWSEQHRRDSENAFPGSGHMKSDEEELARTKRRVRELENEVEILKKQRHTSQRTAGKVWIHPRSPLQICCFEAMPGIASIQKRLLQMGIERLSVRDKDAVTLAIDREKPNHGLIHHSDLGCQYTSKTYHALLDAHQIVGSMSRTGVPYDNAPMESFFHTLKTEHVYKQSFQTVEQAIVSLRYWTDLYYNCRRLHSALGYKSPLFYEISRYHPFCMSA